MGDGSMKKRRKGWKKKSQPVGGASIRVSYGYPGGFPLICDMARRGDNVSTRATGDDPEILYMPNITMAEAALIFGWGRNKFRKWFYNSLSWSIRSCMTGNRRFLSLTDTIRVAYPEASDDMVHTLAVSFNDRFLSQRSKIKKNAAVTRAANKRRAVESTAQPGNSDTQKGWGIGEAKQQDESPLDNATDMANALAEMGEAVAKMQQEIRMIASGVTALMQASLHSDPALATMLQQFGQVLASEPNNPDSGEPSQ